MSPATNPATSSPVNTSMASTSMASTSHAPRCAHCGGVHTAKCPLISAIEYYPDGTTRRVEFHAPPAAVPVDLANFRNPGPARAAIHLVGSATTGSGS